MIVLVEAHAMIRLGPGNSPTLGAEAELDLLSISEGQRPNQTCCQFFSVLFANICASKTFFVQERTPTTFGTSTRLNFMPLRADESIGTHPILFIKTTDYTHTLLFSSRR